MGDHVARSEAAYSISVVSRHADRAAVRLHQALRLTVPAPPSTRSFGRAACLRRPPRLSSERPTPIAGRAARSSTSTTTSGANPQPSPNCAVARFPTKPICFNFWREKLSMPVQLEDIARMLEQSPDFRVLRRLQAA